jgi:transmembrane sensor
MNRIIRAEAAAWIAKLHGPERTPELEEDFKAWLKMDPRHAAAFEHITETWNAIANVNIGGLPRLPDLSSDASRDSRPRGFHISRQAVAVCLLLAAVSLATYNYLTLGNYTTDIGEQRIVALADGSRVYLNSATRLNVYLEPEMRTIRLERGEAYFEVAKDTNRPFKVTAGDRTITALGTSFIVRNDPSSTAVTLIEGKIAVASTSPEASVLSPESGPRTQPSELVLRPGQRLTFRATERDTRIDTPRIEAITAWRRGEVVLDETPLSAAVQEMNRYQRKQLVIDDPDIGTLPISGIYRTGNNQDFANALAAVYELDITADGNDIHVRRKRK